MIIMMLIYLSVAPTMAMTRAKKFTAMGCANMQGDGFRLHFTKGT
jgi:hypothetical protein